MPNPLVSVLIPAYNAEPYIAETIRSVLMQSWRHLEVIIIDDGSRDQTYAIAQQFAGPNVHVVRQDNQGAARARNAAYQMAQGDYIQWLDADDLLSRTKIEAQVRCTDDPRVLLSCRWAHFLFCADRAQFYPSVLWMDLAPGEWLRRKMHDNVHMQPATWLVSRAISDAAGPWDASLTFDDDGEYFCRVLRASTGVRFVDEAAVYYRLTGAQSLSATLDTERGRASLLKSMFLHMDYLLELHDRPEVHDQPGVDAACLRYIETRLSYFPTPPPELLQAAHEFGGTVEQPPLRAKFRWLVPLVGRAVAARAQVVLPVMRYAVLRWMDRLRYRLQPRLDVR